MDAANTGAPAARKKVLRAIKTYLLPYIERHPGRFKEVAAVGRTRAFEVNYEKWSPEIPKDEPND